MHDAHLGRACLLLNILVDFYIAVNDIHGYSMSLPSLVCCWNEVYVVLCQISARTFCTRPFWRMQT